jgi:uncharacterized cupredoxin-like copper-binding protein
MHLLHKTLAVLMIVSFATVGWAQSSQDRISLRVDMGEYYFQVEGQEQNAPIVLQAGQPYEFVFVNVGMMEHEVLIGRDVVVEDGVPDGYEINLLDSVPFDVVGEGWEVEATGLIEMEFEVGTTITIHVTVPEAFVGDWEIGCFIPGHYQAGMKAPVRVE